MEKIKSTKGISIKSIEIKYPGLLLEINKLIKKDEISLIEKIWLYQNNLSDIPTCLNEECNNPVKFKKFCMGYRTYCSRKCACQHTHKNKEVKKLRIRGIGKSNKDPEIRKLMTEKANNTKSKFSQQKKSEILSKRQKTTLDKWGVDNISKNKSIKSKISKKLKESLPKSHMSKLINKINNQNKFDIINIDSDNIGSEFILKCKKCSEPFEISRTLFNQRGRFSINQCLKCNPIGNNSNFEQEVLGFISNIYTGPISSKFKYHRKYEIDVYLPELNIGIECNGLWWHSEEYKENDYHIKKSNFFKDLGIKIIHIWEDDWKLKSEIVKSRLKNVIGMTENRIYARSCEIDFVSPRESNDFLEQNHIQGNINSKHKIGLFFNKELVSLMTFGELRKNLGQIKTLDTYELYRFCTKKNTIVLGGASKLLKYFIKENNPKKIISYASKDWSEGNLYEKIGFDFKRETVPNYSYFHKDQGIRINRFNFRKDKLISEGNDPNKTEREIMIGKGYRRVYDTGSLLYELCL